MKVLYAMSKGLVSYGLSLLYLAHLVAAKTAVDETRRALGDDALR